MDLLVSLLCKDALMDQALGFRGARKINAGTSARAITFLQPFCPGVEALSMVFGLSRPRL